MKRHPLDPFSFFFGSLFAFVGTLFMFAGLDVEDLHLNWVWPIPLIVLGALIILLSLREHRQKPADELEDGVREEIDLP